MKTQTGEFFFAEEADLEGHATTVFSYINFYAENMSEAKAVKVLSNQKPWLHSRVQALLKP